MTYILLMNLAMITMAVGVALWANHKAIGEKMFYGGGVALIAMYMLI